MTPREPQRGGSGRSPDAPNLIRISEATEADVGALASFLWSAWREAGPNAPGWAGATEEILRAQTKPENLLQRLGGPDRRMFIAWEGERVVAFAANRRIDAAEVELAGLVVPESMRGRGIGSRLVDSAVSAAREDGHKRMRVLTEADNGQALAFYVHRGFEPVGTATETVGDVQVDCVKLLLSLNVV